MSEPTNLNSETPLSPAITTLERFLQAIEATTTSTLHVRLLRACRKPDVSAALEAELQSAILEIVREA